MVARGVRRAPRDVVKVWRCAASPSWQINFANRYNIQTVPNQRSNQHRQCGGKILLDIRGRRRLCITAKLAKSDTSAKGPTQKSTGVGSGRAILSKVVHLFCLTDRRHARAT